MKRIWRLLPSFVRWVIVTVVIVCLVSSGVLAYVALTATGDAEVLEPLSFVGSSTFSISLYPQQSEIVQLTIANASPVSILVDLLTLVEPDPGAKGMTFDIPNNITVPASGQIEIDITITAGKNAIPQLYTVTIEVDR